MSVYAYLRISTDKQDLENQRYEVLKYANGKKLGSVEILEETVSGKKSWKKRNILIVPKLSQQRGKHLKFS